MSGFEPVNSSYGSARCATTIAQHLIVILQIQMIK